MSPMAFYALSLLCVAGMVWSIRWMNSPATAVRGNLLGAASVLGGVTLTLKFGGILADGILWIAMAAGSIAGWWLAVTTTALRIPQLVGVLNGSGGAASALAAVVVLRTQAESLGLPERFTAAMALAVGALTLSGSAVAAAKLDRKLPQRSIVFPAHSHLSLVLLVCLVSLIVLTCARHGEGLAVALGLVAAALGIVVSVRVCGADMPVTISLFNSLSGVAGALAGFAVRDPILVSAGAIVGAAGLILTSIMCKAANRSLLGILLGQGSQAATVVAAETTPALPELELRATASKEATSLQEETQAARLARIASILKDARSVIIVPGYGMALAEAQGEVSGLLDLLDRLGKEVRCAVHPLAGRMPGHMHVLLAEAEVPYERLFDIDAINEKFSDTDAVIVVGANDVVNPAASTAVNTPIYGMPVLRANEARWVIICNSDTQPGYSGVPNPLYGSANAVLYLGDAHMTLREIRGALEALA